MDEEDTGDEQETLPPDFKFASYRIGRTLGVGAFGAVYEAFREPLNKRVALKVLHPQLASNQDAVARFIREAELVAQIEHPNIVAVLDVGIESGVPFLAMEFLDGETLTARLTRGGMSVPAALDIVLPVVAAVAVVHERGVVHRDLKPDNIYLSRKVTGAVVPVLLDFGIAKVQETRFSMTRTNSLMGTPFYMSPEHAGALTRRACFWSVQNLTEVFLDASPDAPLAVGPPAVAGPRRRVAPLGSDRARPARSLRPAGWRPVVRRGSSRPRAPLRPGPRRLGRVEA